VNLVSILRLVSVAISISGVAFGQNPIVPPGTYLADPSAHVWADGRLYVYCSRDESPGVYCSGDQAALSSDDLISWDLAPRIFASRGLDDRVAYSDRALFAPDCQFRDGTYYLFYCLAQRPNTAGIATSNAPLGPFGEGRSLDLNGVDEIDPAVFIDDDGQAYTSGVSSRPRWRSSGRA